MKEFIEKLIGRLEEVSEKGVDCNGCQDLYICDEGGCEKRAIDQAIEIVNQLAEEYKPKTQADRIRAMSDEELAQFLLRVNTAYSEPCMLGGCKWEDYPTHDKGCKDCFMEYLQSQIE